MFSPKKDNDNKPTTQFVKFLRVYLNPKEYKKAQEDAEKNKQAQEEILKKYNGEWFAYQRAKQQAKKQNKEFKDPEPIAPKISSDPRIKSREWISKTTEQDLGPLGRIWNHFPISYDEEPAIAKEDFKLIQTIVNKLLEDEQKNKTNTLSHEMKDKVDILTNNFIFLACKELLDEKGELNSEIKTLTGLDRLYKEWKDPDKINKILPQVLSSYINQLVINHVLTSLEDNYQRQLFSRMLKHVENNLNEGNHASGFFANRIQLFVYQSRYKDLLEDLKKMSSDDIKKKVSENPNIPWNEIISIVSSPNAINDKIFKGVAEGLLSHKKEDKNIKIQPQAVFLDDPKGEIENQLQKEYKKWYQDNFPKFSYWHFAMNWKHRQAFYQQVDDPRRHNKKIVKYIDKAYVIKNNLFSELFFLINNERKKANPSLKTVIEKWKEAKINPPYFDNAQGTGKTYSTYYEAISMHTNSLQSGIPQTQKIIDNVMSALLAADNKNVKRL